MKYWYGYPVYECQCGFETPDEDEFRQHLLKKNHLPKEEPVQKSTMKKTGPMPEKPKEENNGIQNESKD